MKGEKMKKSFEEFLREKYGKGVVLNDECVFWIRTAEEWHKSQEKSVEEIKEVISNFDGNIIIRTGYDKEPSITKSGINQIATTIHTLVYGDEVKS